MSSSHMIIVARHDSGKLEFPLGDMTLYGVGEEEDLLRNACKQYDDEWTLALYSPTSGYYGGSKKNVKREQQLALLERLDLAHEALMTMSDDLSERKARAIRGEYFNAYNALLAAIETTGKE